MSEPQYQSYFDHPAEKMGAMASQYWRDDPKMLGIHLARYKFVSKMLAGKKNVAEVGCGDGWFSRLVAREVTNLFIYDFDKRFIDEYYKRENVVNVSARVHDIMWGPLEEKPFDAVFSLDVMEHFSPGNEMDTYLRHIRQSLTDEGVFVVGMPSFESQRYASAASKEGHRGCLNGSEFKKTLEEHYKNVLILSMNDETVHTGFYPMAHYLIGVCTNAR